MKGQGFSEEHFSRPNAQRVKISSPSVAKIISIILICSILSKSTVKPPCLPLLEIRIPF
jgi:hypothetical protein